MPRWFRDVANANGPLSDFSCVAAAVVDVSEVELARQSISERRLPPNCSSCAAAPVIAFRVPKNGKRFPLNLSEKILLFCNAPFSSFFFFALSQVFLCKAESEKEERVGRPSGCAAKDVSDLSHHRHRGSANLRHFVLLKGDQYKAP